MDREYFISLREWVVPKLIKPERIDRFLILQGVHKSRTYLQRLIQGGEVKVNDEVTKPSYLVREGDRIQVRVPAPVPLDIAPEAIPVEVLYEDQYLIVINKPAGLVVHPAPGHYTGTLVNALLHHCKDLSGIGGRERPGIVHRLDKGTTGVLLVAKTDDAHRDLSGQFADHSITRRYQALVLGRLKKGKIQVDLAIGRDTKDRKKVSARTTRPKRASTWIYTIRRFPLATWVEARPETGRTHQIRVHLASMGYPILGDQVYGGRRVAIFNGIPILRPMLHAQLLGFRHPATHKMLHFEAPLPKDMKKLTKSLEETTSLDTK